MNNSHFPKILTTGPIFIKIKVHHYVIYPKQKSHVSGILAQIFADVNYVLKVQTRGGG